MNEEQIEIRESTDALILQLKYENKNLKRDLEISENYIITLRDELYSLHDKYKEAVERYDAIMYLTDYVENNNGILIY